MDQIIDGNLMRKFQQDIGSDSHLRDKYNSKTSGSTASSKFYCQSYDTFEKRLECSGTDLSFKGKVQDIMRMLQGQWGSYGNGVQLRK